VPLSDVCAHPSLLPLLPPQLQQQQHLLLLLLLRLLPSQLQQQPPLLLLCLLLLLLLLQPQLLFPPAASVGSCNTWEGLVRVQCASSSKCQHCHVRLPRSHIMSESCH
jgi:hypothetical protein